MITRLVLVAIRIYQEWLPATLKRHCLYEPSCSRYAELSIQQYGLWRGTRMAISRLRRCRPPVMEWSDYP